MIAHALFLKKIEEIENLSSDPINTYVNFMKLSFISLLFNQTEYGLECLKHSRIFRGKHNINISIKNEPNYFKFLKEIEIAEKHHQIFYPKTLDEYNQYKQESNNSNLSKTTLRNFTKKTLKSIIKSIPGSVFIYKFIIGYDSAFEKVFTKYGFHAQAKLIKEKRVASIQTKP